MVLASIAVIGGFVSVNVAGASQREPVGQHHKVEDAAETGSVGEEEEEVDEQQVTAAGAAAVTRPASVAIVATHHNS